MIVTRLPYMKIKFFIILLLKGLYEKHYIRIENFDDTLLYKGFNLTIFLIKIIHFSIVFIQKQKTIKKKQKLTFIEEVLNFLRVLNFLIF